METGSCSFVFQPNGISFSAATLELKLMLGKEPRCSEDRFNIRTVSTLPRFSRKTLKIPKSFLP